VQRQSGCLLQTRRDDRYESTNQETKVAQKNRETRAAGRFARPGWIWLPDFFSYCLIRRFSGFQERNSVIARTNPNAVTIGCMRDIEFQSTDAGKGRTPPVSNVFQE
jgi:hypothetical protein